MERLQQPKLSEISSITPGIGSWIQDDVVTCVTNKGVDCACCLQRNAVVSKVFPGGFPR